MDEGFQKISLTPEDVKLSDPKEGRLPPAESPKRKSRRSKRVMILFGLVAFFIAVLFFGLVLPVRETYLHVKDIEATGKKLAGAIKKQNLDETKRYALETKEKLNETLKSYNRLAYLRLLPKIGTYYQDGEHGLTAADAGLDSLVITVDSLLPYADLLGLKGKGMFTGGSADERIQTAITTFEKIIPNLSSVGEKVKIVRDEVNAIDPNRYPEKIGNTMIRSRLIMAREMVDTVSTLFLSARPLLSKLPDIMGVAEARRYLVLFQNDKELRPTGGFITAYAIFRVEKGKPIVEKADDIYKLDESRKKKIGAPAEILKYHKGVYYFNLRDSNISPDFVTSMKQFETLYKDVSDPVKYDGIIAVDTHVLVKAIEILGPFVVYERTFSADNDTRCNCPRAIYELEEYATKPVAYVREERKDIIGVLLLQIMQKALGVSPSQYWGRLFQMVLNELNEKHILIHLNNSEAQSGVEALNWGGRIRSYDGDYLQITDTNYAGAKSDLFIERGTRQELTIGSDGAVVKILVIEYKNPAPASDCNLESGGLCLNGLLRNWVRIYVPTGATLLSSSGGESPKDDGTPAEIVSKEDLGKTVFEGYLRVRPQSTSRLEVKYKLPFTVDVKKPYPLLIQKQAGLESSTQTILINGKQKELFKLTSDRELKIKF